MTFPVPKDVRTTRNFELVNGGDEMVRTSRPIADMTATLDPGEFVKLDASGNIAKILVGDNAASPAVGALACWTLFRPGDSNAGQSDALATSEAEVLTGPYQAKTKLYDTGATYLAGAPLVAIFDAGTSRGVLHPLDPAAATARQLAAVVGYVVQPPTAGQLWFASQK